MAREQHDEKAARIERLKQKYGAEAIENGNACGALDRLRQVCAA